MRLAALALACALLAGGASAFTQPAYPIRANVTTKRITNQLVLSSTLQGIINLPALLANGSFQVNPLGKATEKVEVTDAGCLDTVIPPPLNWGPLWCAGREAKVMQWTDDVGSLHREISIPLQPNVTANMVLWLFSPLFPQFLEFNGKMWYWYHLWHPMDHIMAANTVGPSPYYIGKPGIYTLIHEHYRNPKGQENLPEWESDAWFHVEDLMSNFIKKRVVISINTVGMQAWTLIVNLKDTPAGLKIDCEQVIGLAKQGYDPTDPAKGMPAELARVINDNLIHPVLEKETPGAEFMRSTNAITRHVVEEFSMFRFFLPQVWGRFPQIKAAMDLADGLNQAVPRWNYGPKMFKQPADTTGILEVLTPFNRTQLHNMKAAAGALRAAPAAVAKGASMNLNSRAATVTRHANELVASVRTLSKSEFPTVSLKIIVPSAAGGALPPLLARNGTSA